MSLSSVGKPSAGGEEGENKGKAYSAKACVTYCQHLWSTIVWFIFAIWEL